MHELRVTSRNLEDTNRLGGALGRSARAGLVVALRGTLGSGKTAFVRAVAEGLDVPDPRVVTSPTFLLIQEYAGRLPIYHFDTYRLAGPAEFADLGPEEYFEGDGVCLVEWADRVESLLPADRIELAFEVTGNESRSIAARCLGNRHAEIFERWSRSVQAGG